MLSALRHRLQVLVALSLMLAVLLVLLSAPLACFAAASTTPCSADTRSTPTGGPLTHTAEAVAQTFGTLQHQASTCSHAHAKTQVPDFAQSSSHSVAIVAVVADAVLPAHAPLTSALRDRPGALSGVLLTASQLRI